MTNQITMTHLNKLISENKYIISCFSNKKKDISSLSYLINRELSQSDCIKLGNGVEKLLVDLVTQNTKVKNIKPKNKKGTKEKDHLFCDENTKTIYYAELKANINLDTEKSNATYMKCLDIIEKLKKEYPDYSIKWCLLGYRYLNYSDISNTIQKKYKCIDANLYGINQYLTMLNIDLQFTNEKYKEFLNNIADAMFN